MSRDKDPTDCGYWTVECTTSAAIMVTDDAGDAYWVPRSQICDESDIDEDSEAGDEGILILPEWLAIEKGMA